MLVLLKPPKRWFGAVALAGLILHLLTSVVCAQSPNDDRAPAVVIALSSKISKCFPDSHYLELKEITELSIHNYLSVQRSPTEEDNALWTEQAQQNCAQYYESFIKLLGDPELSADNYSRILVNSLSAVLTPWFTDLIVMLSEQLEAKGNAKIRSALLSGVAEELEFLLDNCEQKLFAQFQMKNTCNENLIAGSLNTILDDFEQAINQYAEQINTNPYVIKMYFDQMKNLRKKLH